MKSFHLIIVLLLTSGSLHAQALEEMYDLKFKSKKDYQKHEASVLKASNYLLDNPINNDNLDYLFASQFILKWMEGTSDYTFEIGEDLSTLTGGDADLMSVYLASLSKFALDTEAHLSPEEINIGAKELFIKYCLKDGNNIKMHRALKKELKGK